ncbi:MAG: CpsD/CapB family tyrosine-protein kinase [Lachnospiraceae bacterium]|nr:CpsD/CapB family tyrosine-protein kinase [Lachnospiraceae bacterium]
MDVETKKSLGNARERGLNKIFIREGLHESVRTKELFRMLRTNVEFSGSENQVIALTSCTPGDGKSTVSFQLAQSFAEIGERVLFIDADMRKSKLRDRMFSIKEDAIGLSHILAAKNELRESIHVTNIKGLYILPTGVFPANPAELLGKAVFGELLEGLRKKFSYIFIDTPPISSVIDAAVVANKCDGTIIVVAADKNSRHEEKKAVEQIRRANPNILGVVLNKVNTGFASHYGSYQRQQTKYYQEDVSAQKRRGVNMKDIEVIITGERSNEDK